MIFVFGSNLAGRHGAGAALAALKYHGAVLGVGAGPQGNAYAIPTKDMQIRTMPIDYILPYVEEFLSHARLHPEIGFQVTRIGCGLAGYRNDEIAPLFTEAPKENCFFDLAWRPYLPEGFEFWGSF